MSLFVSFAHLQQHRLQYRESKLFTDLPLLVVRGCFVDAKRPLRNDVYYVIVSERSERGNLRWLSRSLRLLFAMTVEGAMMA